MLAKIWRWLKKLWQQLLGKPPQPSPRSAGTPGGKPNPRLSDAELENLFLQLLDRIGEGASRENIKSFLIGKGINEADLVAWLGHFGGRLLESSVPNHQLARRMVLLGELEYNKSGEIALEIGRKLLARENPQTALTSTYTVEVLLEQGHNQIYRGQYKAAIHSFLQALALELQNPKIWFGLGFAHYLLRDYQDSVDCLSQALQIKESYALALAFRGWAYEKLNQPEKAKVDFEQTIKIKPQDYEDWLGRGIAFDGLSTLDGLKRDIEVLESYIKVIEFKRDSCGVWHGCGILLANLGSNNEEALACFNQAIKLTPDYQDAWRRRGVVLLNMRRYEQAIASCKTAIAINQDSYKAWCSLGIVQANSNSDNNSKQDDQERNNEALESYEQALTLRKDYPEAFYNKGIALSILGRNDEAIASYEEATRLKPNYAEAWYRLGLAQVKLGSGIKLAIKSYKKAIKYKPDHLEAYYRIGFAYERLAQSQLALPNYHKVIEMNQDYPEIWDSHKRNVSRLLKLNGYENYIITLCKKALKIKPDYHEAHYFIGKALEKLEKYDEAVYFYQRATELLEAHQEAWKGLGDALTSLGDKIGSYKKYKEAIAAYEKVEELNEFNWQAWNNHGWALFKSKRYGKALEIWQKALGILKPDNLKKIKGYHERKQGCAELYFSLGKYYQDSRFWSKAQESYEEAKVLLEEIRTDIDTGEIYLKILESLIIVCQYRTQSQEVLEELLNDGSDLLARLMKDTKSQGKQNWLHRRFSTFDQLRVDQLVLSRKPKEALKRAEERKNLCLSWLRGKDADSLSLDIEPLLSANTAAIYWHVSPAAITTFILKHGEEPFVFCGNASQNIEPQDTDYQIGTANQLRQFEEWMAKWKWDYQRYRKETRKEMPKKVGKNNVIFKANEFWMKTMVKRLNELADILDISGILKQLDFKVQKLILIPHRDLHLLPLHYLLREKNFTITYIPSLKVGIDLQTDTPSTPKKLLSIESPSRLEYAETESQIIAQIYDNPTCIKSSKVTKNKVITAFSNSADIFHFTGHGEHNIHHPLESALELANEEMLTLQDIFQLNLKGYQLACLSACETGITSKQGIIDEYVGLVSGFLATGVTHVISTLWQVGEIETALMMIKFHQLYKDNIPPALALQQTQIWLSTLTFPDLIQWYRQESAKLEEGSGCWESLQGLIGKAQQEAEIKGMNYRPYSHPYHWAGFIVSGNHQKPIISCPLDYP
ncbi:tetratricopeptide repeat protein [Aerosakkonema sp. BLCC-F183]|uniref:tetratricopeptide repeat protein n=1 Tax=Aerosakkonema sp. BLCC-F183 TaxID=3342834 RepID=UPI0035B8ED16